MYAPDWKDGRPTEEPIVEGFVREDMLPRWIRRSPRLVKVLTIESFEDTLNALELPKERKQRQEGQMPLSLADELHYALEYSAEGSNVNLNTQQLKHPFSYDLRAITPDGSRSITVNLIETANLLLGLRPHRFYELNDSGDKGKSKGRRYVIVEARQGEDEVLVIWRDIDNPSPLDPKREVAFLEEHFDLEDYDAIYANADSPVARGDYSLDQKLLQQMMAREV
jgi:adenine-specific DNA-methyltransferase